MRMKSLMLIPLAIGLVILNQSMLSHRIDKMTNELNENYGVNVNVFALDRMQLDQREQVLTKKFGIDVSKVIILNRGSTANVEIKVLNPGLFTTKTVVLKDMPSHTREALDISAYATEKLNNMPKDADIDTYVNNLNTEMKQKFSVSTTCNPDIRVDKNKNSVTYTLYPNNKYKFYGGSNYDESIVLNVN